MAALTAPAAAAPALWEVSDADSRIFLFGSFHALPDGIDWQTPLLTETIASAPKVYFEADIGIFAQAWVVVSMFASGINFDRTPWTDKLSDAAYVALGRALTPLGMTVDDVETYEPWVVTLMLEGQDTGGADLAMAAGVEATIQRGLPRDRVGYLETANQQLQLFSSGTEDEQLAILTAQAMRPDELTGGVDGIVDAWASGDDAALLQLFEADVSAADTPFLDRLLYQRNRNWIAPIEQMLAGNDPDLVVVGAAHLLGSRGLVALLRDAGYTVTRVQ